MLPTQPTLASEPARPAYAPATPPTPLTPPIVRRIGWWFLPPTLLVLVAAAVLIFAPGWIHSLYRATGAGSGLLIPLTFQVPFLITWVFVVRAQRRVRRAVVDSAGHACTQCLHDLRGLDRVGTCPECGRPFDIQRDRASWQRVGALKSGESWPDHPPASAAHPER